jgi:hypothetical protein
LASKPTQETVLENLMLKIKETKCCAVREIYDLSTHNHDPKGAMLEFCRKYSTYGYLCDIYSFYIFTGVVRVTDDDCPMNYVEEFTKFIRDHDLGTVVLTGGVPNWINHPSHIVKVAVWSPNVSNLKLWWLRNKKGSI